MKQIFCLAAPGRSKQLEPLFNELDMVPIFLDIGKVKSLMAFVNKEKTLPQMDYILFDLDGCGYSQEHILSAVQQIRRFSIAEMIFLSPAGEDTDLLYGRLANFRLSNLIAVDSRTDVTAELRACFEEEGGNYHRRLSAMANSMAATATRQASSLRIPPGMVLSVAVAGAQARVGVTTQCFALYHYLKGLGFHPALLDEGGETLELLTSLYAEQAQPQEGYTLINGIPFCTRRAPEFNAYVTDLGVLRPELAACFSAQDISVLVGGAKPWELPHLADALRLLADTPRRLAVLVSFATQRDMDEIGQYLGGHAANVPYHPDIWEPGSTGAYQSALFPCLQALCAGEA